MLDDHTSSQSNRGRVRLFPLPNFVLFPGAIQPLHIFEPRYRQLMTDALDDDRRITMTLLRPGWEEEYHKDPPIYPTVCVGRIYQEELLTEGRYNLLLQGERRARIVEEVETEKLYRIAEVEWLDDVHVSADVAESARSQLLQTVSSWAKSRKLSLNHLDQMLKGKVCLGAVSDVLAFALPLPLELKQQLLDEPVVLHRAQTLLRILRETTPTNKPQYTKFPPDFSEN